MAWNSYVHRRITCTAQILCALPLHMHVVFRAPRCHYILISIFVPSCRCWFKACLISLLFLASNMSGDDNSLHRAGLIWITTDRRLKRAALTARERQSIFLSQSQIRLRSKMRYSKFVSWWAHIPTKYWCVFLSRDSEVVKSPASLWAPFLHMEYSPRSLCFPSLNEELFMDNMSHLIIKWQQSKIWNKIAVIWQKWLTACVSVFLRPIFSGRLTVVFLS